MKFLEPTWPLEQPLHKRITATGMGKWSLSWSSLASRAQVTWTGSHHGQVTALERVSSLPAAAAEPNEPKRKSCPTGSSDCRDKHWKYQCNDGEESLLLSLSKWMRSLRGGIDHPSLPGADWARPCLGPHSTLEMPLSFARREAEPKRLQL